MVVKFGVILIVAPLAGFKYLRRSLVRALIAYLVDPRHRPGERLPKARKDNDALAKLLTLLHDDVSENIMVRLVGRESLVTVSAGIFLKPFLHVQFAAIVSKMFPFFIAKAENPMHRIADVSSARLPLVQVLNRAVWVSQAISKCPHETRFVRVKQRESFRLLASMHLVHARPQHLHPATLRDCRNRRIEQYDKQNDNATDEKCIRVSTFATPLPFVPPLRVPHRVSVRARATVTAGRRFQ